LGLVPEGKHLGAGFGPAAYRGYSDHVGWQLKPVQH